jgi:cytochrome P450
MIEDMVIGELAVLITAIAGVVIWRWRRTQKKYSSLRSLPSPPRHWLLGNTPQLLTAAKERKVFSLFCDWALELGPMYVLWVAGRPGLVLSKPKVIEEILTRQQKDLTFVRSPEIRKLWKELFAGSTIIEQEGSEWQWRRQTYNQSLTPTHLNNYLEIISLGCNQVVEKLKDAAQNQEVVQTDPLFTELTMKLISCFLLGIPLNKESLSHEGPPLETGKLYEVLSILTRQFLAEFAGEKKWFKYLPSLSAKTYWNAKEYLDEFIAPRVDLALQIVKRKKSLTTFEVSSSFKNSMLVHLAGQSQFTEDMLCAEPKLMLFAGH